MLLKIWRALNTWALTPLHPNPASVARFACEHAIRQRTVIFELLWKKYKVYRLCFFILYFLCYIKSDPSLSRYLFVVELSQSFEVNNLKREKAKRARQSGPVALSGVSRFSSEAYLNDAVSNAKKWMSYGKLCARGSEVWHPKNNSTDTSQIGIMRKITWKILTVFKQNRRLNYW